MSLVGSRRAPQWRTSLIVDGLDVAGDGPSFDVPDPSTEEVLAEVAAASVDQVDRAVRAARRAFDHGTWATMPGEQRAKLLHAFADAVEEMRDELEAGLIHELGTPVTLARSLHTDVAVQVLRTYADLAAKNRDEDLGEAGGPVRSRSRVTYLPLGVVGVITAYNVPLLIAARAMGGALAAGCTVVLMPSPRAPLTTIMMAAAARTAGIPDGVINVVVGGPEVGQRLTSHPDVDKIAFTGSVGVGRKIMEQASHGLRRLSLELGGKSPSLVLPGFDYTPWVYDLHARYLRNGGQGCAAPARILVPEESYDDFCEQSRDAFARIKTGDPWDPETIVGPMIRPDHLEYVRAQVDRALDSGADLVARGPDHGQERGWFTSPVLIGGVAPDDPIAQDEIFGPVGIVLPYRDVDDGIAQANATAFGLSANVYCGDPAEGVALARRLRSGAVVINGGGPFRPDAPFGGFRDSGFGREYGEWGVREFLDTQHVQWTY
jgi:aldehyde dehydrogenase (NAD+)/betaine-aldehyde dehydrogenase